MDQRYLAFPPHLEFLLDDRTLQIRIASEIHRILQTIWTTSPSFTANTSSSPNPSTQAFTESTPTDLFGRVCFCRAETRSDISRRLDVRRSASGPTKVDDRTTQNYRPKRRSQPRRSQNHSSPESEYYSRALERR